MRLLLILTLIVAFCIEGQSQTNKYSTKLNLHEDFYKPYRSPISTSYAYFELGLSRVGGKKRIVDQIEYRNSDGFYDYMNPDISHLKGKTIRLGVVRAFMLNKYKFDPNKGYLGKKNKLYGQFNFGWFFHSGYMAHKYFLDVSLGSNPYDYIIDFSYNGFEIGTGLVQNIGNRLALETNFSWIPLVLGGNENETNRLKSDPTGKQGILWNVGIRIKHFSLTFNWNAISMKAYMQSTGNWVDDAPRYRYSSYHTGLRYVYNF